MKILISYPPLESPEGVPLLSQNRQFQYFKKPTYIYPVVPAQAATLLKQNGFDVVWDDAIAERKTYQEWLKDVIALKPDIVAIETKTPVIKQHWQIVDTVKSCVPGVKVVLFGDHVTALPEESFRNSKVDYVLTGGDYDFLLLSLCKGKLEPGIYYREDGRIKNTGRFKLDHDLNTLPFIDRDLTKWQLYAYENGNYKCVPGTYIMSGRDCWWARCKFCITPDMKVFSSEGLIPIGSLIEHRADKNMEFKDIRVLTHLGRFKKINQYFQRPYNGTIVKIELYNLKMPLKLTSNHKVYALKLDKMMRCSNRNSSNYVCKPDRKSSYLMCEKCDRHYYKNYTVELIRADELNIGDYVAVPIIKESKDVGKIIVKDFLNTLEKSTEKIGDRCIDSILELNRIGQSQRVISRRLAIDRSTIKKYITLNKTGALIKADISIFDKDGYILYDRGKNKIRSEIEISKDFMRLVGYYLAEGHVSVLKDRPNSCNLVFTFSEREDFFIKDVKNLLEKCIGISPSIIKNKANHTVQITVYCTVFARLFENLFGLLSVNKKMPDFFIYLPEDKQRELLVGLFRGDAHLRLRKSGKGGSEYIYETVSPILAQQIFILLLRQGIIPKYRVIEPYGKKVKHTKYVLSLCNIDIMKLFPEIVLPKRNYSYTRSFILNNYAFVPIKKINTEIYNGYVYNLSVEDDHSYTVNNVAVSNCSWTSIYPRFRVRKVENVLDEIGYLIDEYGIKEIMDDTGTFPTGNWIREFCKGMIERGYNKKVYIDCNMRFNACTLEDYRLMKRANFRLLLFGLESANQKTLDRINKNLRVEEIIESCRLARSSGLFPHITIMFGYPWETFEDAKKTLELGRWLLKKGYAYTVQATVVIPYPGTPLFDECKEKGWLKTLDWDRYDMKEPVMKTPMPSWQVMRFVQGIYSVAFNPEFIWRRIRTIEGPNDIRYFVRGIKKVIGHIVDFKP